MTLPALTQSAATLLATIRRATEQLDALAADEHAAALREMERAAHAARERMAKLAASARATLAQTARDAAAVADALAADLAAPTPPASRQTPAEASDAEAAARKQEEAEIAADTDAIDAAEQFATADEAADASPGVVELREVATDLGATVQKDGSILGPVVTDRNAALTHALAAEAEVRQQAEEVAATLQAVNDANDAAPKPSTNGRTPRRRRGSK